MIGKNFNISTADRLFISANFSEHHVAGNTAKDLIRYEFLEVLVRIAKVIYVDTGICTTYTAALESLFNAITPNFHPFQTWQRWREEELWTNECNQILEANQWGLRRLYDGLINEKNPTVVRKQITMKEAVELFTVSCGLKLSAKDCKYCFGMSKMTIANEEFDHEKYSKMMFVEFLEMIGRVAVAEYQNSDLANEALATKIEYIVDAILWTIDEERCAYVEHVRDESESDEDY